LKVGTILSRRKRETHEEHAGNHERWLLTYADMITLLMIFFIIMYSMSILDAKKFSSLAASLSGALNGTPATLQGSEGILDSGVPNQIPTSATESDDGDLNSDTSTEKQIIDLIEKGGLEDKVTIINSETTITIQLKDNLLFDPGSSVLKTESHETLTALIDIVEPLDNKIRIEGYTDNVPTNSKLYLTNWELASQRAINVLKYFIQNSVVPSRLSAESFGEYWPIVPNDTEENKQENRRVDIVIIKHIK